MNSIFSAGDDELGVNSSMGAVEPQISDPPLGCAYFWSVDDKGLTGCIIGGSGQQILDIGPVSKLCLSIAA